MSANPAVNPSTTPGAATPAKPEVKPTAYTLGIDRGTLERLWSWGATYDEDGIDDAFPNPENLIPDDVIVCGEATGHTRRAAVEAWLDMTDPNTESVLRRRWLRKADDAGIKLDFTTIPTGYIGTVPIETEVVTTRKRKP